jgi:hypothetical protein
VASGKINLDAPIGRYFPEYPKWQKIISTLLADKAVQQDITKYQHETTLPSYCSEVKPAEKWSFVNF